MNTGDFLGRYRIVRKIGEGGMGEVFLAEDQKLNRPIAVKVLSADFASDSDRMMRFVHEAISASALNHPNIITIYEINDENVPPFIAMEYVEGETLGRRIRQGSLEIYETLDIAIQIATALAAAHDAGVVHRDVKPDNVILRPDGLIKVLDFGLAKQIASSSANSFEAATVPNVKTLPGLVMGTIAYMSPEQARGKMVDARSDIFSFGAMLYQMVSGRLPFIGESDLDVVGSILHKDPLPLNEPARLIPHDLDLLIRTALRKDRDERYQSMREILDDLKEIREAQLFDSKNGDRPNAKSNGNGGFRRHSTNEDLNGISTDPPDEVERGIPTEYMHAANIHSTRELSVPPNTFSGVLLSEIKTHPVRSAVVSVIAALILVGIVFGLYRLYDGLRSGDGFQTMRFDKLTFGGNVSNEQVTVSPDGKYFAFVVDNGGEQSLWVKQTATDSNVQIIRPSSERFRGLTFSPDGNRIYFALIEKNGTTSLNQIPALGGPTRRLLTGVTGPISFSPDGKSISFVRDSTSLVIADADGGNAKEYAASDGNDKWLRTAFSPDGTRIAAIYYSATDAFDHLAEITIADGSKRLIEPPQWQRLRAVVWMPDGKLLVTGRDLESQYSQIWKIDPAAGSRQRVTNDLNSYHGLSLTADAKSVLSTQQNVLSNLWIAGSFSEKPLKITSEIGKNDGMSGVAFTPDGRVLYTTRIRGDQDIWIVNGDGSENKQLTVNSGANFSPAVSPDGRFVVFVSTRNGDSSLWRMDIDGGNQTQLTFDPGMETEPAITPDGNWIVFQYTDPANKTRIRKIPTAGGDSIAITEKEAGYPTISPDGKYILCRYELNGSESDKVAVIDMTGVEAISVLNSPAMGKSRNIRFSGDGKSLIYIESRNQVDNLWSQPIKGGTPTQLTDFNSDRIFRFDLSRSTGKFVFARGTDTSDVVMITNFR